MSRIVLIDRDGTINVEQHYLSEPNQIELIPESADGIKLLKGLGLCLVVVTNQSGVSRGYFDLEQLNRINIRLQEVLLESGASIDAIYFCPHLPQNECECRKPATGMALKAAREFRSDLSTSFVIGDNTCDIKLGENIGSTTILVRTGHGNKVENEALVKPDHITDNLLTAAMVIKEILEKEEAVQQNLNIELMKDKARRHLLESAELKQAVAENCSKEISQAGLVLIECFENEGKVLFCGNGGSAADCQHIAAELTSVLSKNFVRPGLPAIALTTDTSFITASANDFGFEGIFERQVQALGRKGDVLVGISTSGDSENVLCALKFARNRGIRTIALTGATGGQIADVVDITIKVPNKNTQLIQESHISVGHILCELVELGMFGNESI